MIKKSPTGLFGVYDVPPHSSLRLSAPKGPTGAPTVTSIDLTLSIDLSAVSPIGLNVDCYESCNRATTLTSIDLIVSGATEEEAEATAKDPEATAATTAEAGVTIRDPKATATSSEAKAT